LCGCALQDLDLDLLARLLPQPREPLLPRLLVLRELLEEPLLRRRRPLAHRLAPRPTRRDHPNLLHLSLWTPPHVLNAKAE